MRAPERLTGLQPKSASENELGSGLGRSRAMTSAEIEGTIQAFGLAAKRCEEAGLQGVELHGAHGYLIAQFLGASTNRRSDEWGGNQRKRTRFLEEIVKKYAVQRARFFGRCSSITVLRACGLDLDDALETLRLCNEMQLDFVHVSCWDINETGPYNGVERPYTTHFRDVLADGIPLISTGGVWNADDARLAHHQGADLVGVARAGIAHPDWPSYLCAGSCEPSRPPLMKPRCRRAKLNSNIHRLHASLGRFCLGLNAPAAIRTRVPGSGGRGDIHYTTGASLWQHSCLSGLLNLDLWLPRQIEGRPCPNNTTASGVLHRLNTVQHHPHQIRMWCICTKKSQMVVGRLGGFNQNIRFGKGPATLEAIAESKSTGSLA